VPTRDAGDLGQLLWSRSELVHVPPGSKRVVAHEREAVGALEIVDRSSRATDVGCEPPGSRGLAHERSVGDQRDLGAPRPDVAGGMGHMELVRRTAHIGRVDDVGVQAEVLGEADTGKAGLRLTHVIESVDISPVEPCILECLRRALGLDGVHGRGGGDPEGILVDTGDHRLTGGHENCPRVAAP
jgi:hypothetical protein